MPDTAMLGIHYARDAQPGSAGTSADLIYHGGPVEADSVREAFPAGRATTSSTPAKWVS